MPKSKRKFSKLTYLSPRDGFLEADRIDADHPQSAKAVVVPYGLEASVSYGGGTRRGPAAILAASHQLELFDEEFWREPYLNYGVATLAPPVIPAKIEDALAQLAQLNRHILEAGRFPLVLGGEHSLTAGAIRPFAERYDDLAVLQFDAHADLRDGYLGEKYSHASAMRRVLDHRHVALVSVGIRSISVEEIPFVEANRHILEAGRFPLVLGGEHSLTAGAIRPFAERYDDLAVLQFDAHADLRDGYLGEKYSHASAMRRVLDHRHVALVSVGIRSISVEEIPFVEANRHRLHMHFAKDQANWDLDTMLAPLAGRSIYISFDVDGLDCAAMPATGTPEPGGLSFWQVCTILRRASQIGRIVGADLVELAPIKGLHACDFTAAKLAYKILNYALGGNAASARL